MQISRSSLAPRGPRLLLTAVVAVLALLVATAAPLEAQSDRTPGLDEARERAQQAVQELTDMEAALGEIDGEIRRYEADVDDAEAELAVLREDVRELAVHRYTQGDQVPAVTGDINAQERAKVLVQTVSRHNFNAMDQYRATRERLDRALDELEDRLAAQEDMLEELTELRREVDIELARLEEIENERLSEEERRRKEREEAEREAAEEARREAEAEAARAAEEEERRSAEATTTTTTTTTPSTTEAPTTTSGSGGSSNGGGSGSDRLGSGSWICPVQGTNTFVDSWMAPRPGGMSHQGVDLMSPRGTPVVIPVAGDVTFGSGARSGLDYRLDGDDGNYYFGAHLDSYAGVSEGHHPAGTVVGYVGDTGDAKGTGTHLHFEIHKGGYGNAVNPYPTVKQHC